MFWFENKINKDDLAGIKLFTTEIEDKYRKYKKRKINIPGLGQKYIYEKNPFITHIAPAAFML